MKIKKNTGKDTQAYVLTEVNEIHQNEQAVPQAAIRVGSG